MRDSVIEQCSRCRMWHGVRFEVYVDSPRFHIYCGDCGCTTVESDNVDLVIDEWREKWEKSEEVRRPTADTWARIYGGE